MKKIAIIGGGPAGVMCAATAAKNNDDVHLFEKNNRLMKKLLITGKGRCNITNSSDISDFFYNIPVNHEFLYSAFYTFTNEDIINLLNNEGLKTKNERGNRVFPVSDKASDVADALERHLKKSGAKIHLNAEVENIEKKGDKFILYINKKRQEFDKVVIATGGLSYPVTGSTGDGYRFSQKLGHTVTELEPNLVPLTVKESFCKEMTGLSLRNVCVKLKSNKKVIFEDFGEMMFTPYGVTGPLIISASSHLNKKNINNDNILLIDLKPALSEKQLDDRILRDFCEFSNKDFSNSLNKLLPKSMISVIIEKSGIDSHKKCNSITKEERRHLVELLKNFTLTVTGKRPIKEAIITSGGISVNEINPSTMHSKIIDGLYFCGEVIDTDAYTGGFNLQIAYSTGYLAGISL